MMEREDIRACRDNISKCILKALDPSLIPNYYFFTITIKYLYKESHLQNSSFLNQEENRVTV